MSVPHDSESRTVIGRLETRGEPQGKIPSSLHLGGWHEKA